MKRAIILSILLLSLLASLAAGCAPQASGPKPIQEAVTITFSVPQEYQSLYDPLLEKFKEREPNITVKVQWMGFGGGQGGDVSLVRWYQLNQAGYLENNAPLDLTPFIQQDGALFKKDDYFAGALETFTRQGKLMALPTGVDPSVIFYNMDLFDKMGAPYPQPGWTWEQFRLAAEQVTDVEAGIFGYCPDQRYMDSLYFIYQNGGALYDENQNPKIDSPQTVRAVEWYTSLFGPDGPAATESQMRDAFGQGSRGVGIVTSKVGMWVGTVSSLTADYGGMIRFRVGMAPLPRGEGGVSLAQFEGLSINAKAANPQAAWRLVSFLAQQPVAWVYPARKSLAESEVFISSFGKDQAAGVRATIENASTVTGMNFGRFGTATLVLSDVLRSVISEGVPAAEALQAGQERLQK